MGLTIKPRQDILSDIIHEAKQYPQGWKATFGRDPVRLSYDCYISHPEIGIYLLKEYAKNPFERKGFGAKIARSIDDDIEQQIRKNPGDFGIIHSNIQKILRNIQRGIPPEAILNAALNGDDLGIRIPVKGQASRSEGTFSYIHDAFSAKQKNLDNRFEKMMADEGAYTSYD